MSKREVTEFDLRAPEFQRSDVKPEDYEFREDGKVVRKDRWEMAVRNIVSILGWSRREFELPEVVAEVRRRLDYGVDGDEEYDSWEIVPIGVTAPAQPTRTPEASLLKLLREVLDDTRGNINPERGYAEELETAITRAVSAIDAHGVSAPAGQPES